MHHVGELVPVHAPATGKVFWFWESFTYDEGGRIEIGPDEVLGFVRTEDGEEWLIRSPLVGAKGLLFLLFKESGKDVDITERIAWIKITAIMSA
ncbi:MAG TPA: hypothetical protein VJZ02_06625 [Candidatus Brocadiales bacterium]|nr:hypothetical protein [Candidatus Brocadiales bacterium]